MGQSHFLPDEMGSTERPGLISGLGIVSFINTVLFMLLYGLGALGMMGLHEIPFDDFSAKANEAMVPFMTNLSEEDKARIPEVLKLVYDNGLLLVGVLFLRTLVRFIGVLGMWKGRRRGFFTYAGAQVAGIFLPHLVLPLSYLGFWGPLLAIAFTAMYGTQLKRLG